MIDRFYDNSTIGDGELTKLDILKSVWKCLLDTENMYDFLYRNTNEEQRRDLVYGKCLCPYCEIPCAAAWSVGCVTTAMMRSILPGVPNNMCRCMCTGRAILIVVVDETH
jgi:hypothetical protein